MWVPVGSSKYATFKNCIFSYTAKNMELLEPGTRFLIFFYLFKKKQGVTAGSQPKIPVPSRFHVGLLGTFSGDKSVDNSIIATYCSKFP